MKKEQLETLIEECNDLSASIHKFHLKFITAIGGKLPVKPGPEQAVSKRLDDGQNEINTATRYLTFCEIETD